MALTNTTWNKCCTG